MREEGGSTCRKRKREKGIEELWGEGECEREREGVGREKERMRMGELWVGKRV